MKEYNFIINNRIIEVSAKDLEQAEMMAKIISNQYEKEQK